MADADAGTIDRLRGAVLGRLEALRPRMQRLAEEIHKDPELGCEEIHAAARFAGELEEEGFSVETGVGGLATAFRAVRGGASGPTVALLAEYDAIPGLGHAAGHNLIAAAAYGAAVSLSSVVEETGGRVMVIGAPAEETIGGKVVLAVRGVFEGIDAAMLAHPAREDRPSVTSLASWSVDVVFRGRSAHAITAPEEGVNALDAMIQLFVARDALLDSLGPEVRMPGVILEGGIRPNLIPEFCRARFSLRAASAGYLAGTVITSFREAVQGVATATGTNASVSPIDNLYDEFVSNPEMAETYARHAQQAGMAPIDGVGRPFGSLDIGTLSHAVPCIHPLYRVTHDESMPTHSPEFAEIANSTHAHAATHRAASALALTGLDLISSPSLLERARRTHADQTAGWQRPPDAKLITAPVDR